MPASASPAPVTVVGLGDMGTALARAFLTAGHPVTVWNRSAAKADPLVAEGAVRAASPAAAVEASPLVVACVLDYPALREALGSAESRLDGRTLVNLTNGTPEEAQETGAWARGLGAAYIDGGIMAVPAMIGTPDAAVLYSGDASAFGRHEAALRVLGPASFLGPADGTAALNDIALLTGMYGLLGGFVHAAALIRSEGAADGSEGGSVTEFTENRLLPWLTAMTGILPALARQVDSGDFRTEGSGLAMQLRAYENFLSASRARGVRTDLIAPFHALMERALSAGAGPSDDVSALVDTLRDGRG
ncbi:NAD(P)-dependent oxidoreductase [Nocardiopsis suaedae]|uniref:NAD(P)-binding domain-containing protein n=1 Tax=Nocardiopsis suaedae TaxID=3018444 RepID=A0ABT4TFW9_9ACTN|nr:NAD(P)-binding domain-containing protein [Nocardiopsis suaedae]MDA2803476.1 NAD(P)-binding domain-containing protein [Nocardiopsis suaedae]